MARAARDPVERFVEKIGPVRSDGCLLWLGKPQDNGYGRFFLSKQGGPVNVSAHRFAFELAAGRPVRPGYEIHHTCENKLCVEPSHLEEIVRGGHVAIHRPLATHCTHGHEFTPENTYVRGYSSTGRPLRTCRRCHSENEARRGREKRAAARA